MRAEGVVAEAVRLEVYPGGGEGLVVGAGDERDMDVSVGLVRWLLSERCIWRGLEYLRVCKTTYMV